MNVSLDASVAVRDGSGSLQTATIVGGVGPCATAVTIRHAWQEAIRGALSPVLILPCQIEELGLTGEINGVGFSVSATLAGPESSFDEVRWCLDCRANTPRNPERMSATVYVREGQSTLREIARAVAEWFAPIEERLDEQSETSSFDALEWVY